MHASKNCFDSKNNQTSPVAVGAIDPGLAGAIAIMRGSKISATNPENDSEACKIVREAMAEGPIVWFLERVGGYIEGKELPGSRMFTFGDNFGHWRGVLNMAGADWRLVQPQVWQRGITGLKGEYSKRKKTLRAHAQRLFPDLEVTLETADALCILHYGEASLRLTAEAQAAKPTVARQKHAHPLDGLTHAELMAKAVAWAESQGWAVPAPRTAERRQMVDWWINKALNDEL